MNNVLSKKTTIARTAIIDAALLAAACLIPTLSHITALPLYMLNPMLLVLLAGMLAVRSRTNAFLLAVLLPVVSMLAVGMPTPLKALCMAAEMLSIVGVYPLLQRLWRAAATRPWASFAAIVAAMLCGKVVYYALKALVIAPAALVTTPVATQAIVALVAAALFCSAQYLTTRGK